MSQLTVSRTTATQTNLILIAIILYNFNGPANGQSILERFRPNSNITANVNDEQVKIISGTKVKRYERLTVPINAGTLNLLQPHPPYVGLAYVAPNWQAGAKLTGEGIEGMITFQQLPYNNDIKVTLNATGLPEGKHALHIHTYGDLSDDCKATGGQFPNNFLGNIDVKEGGEVNVAFISIYLTLFGYNGIVGRSVVIHEKPIDINSALNAEVFSSPIHPIPTVNQVYQNEENSVGASIACGIISIMSSPIPTVNKK
ncbi:superoxide dismutase [Cu-Zn] 5-like isoform X2 [Musca domestica]|uniref:superoxide dismutase n=1 Tax=Musca domestica TaxID=7370 RepID=A0ABM3VFF3_MUSDO|nr:superoxide dismutase [Cu-Zn] 5-like isoform X2 [Musca domestica]